eukprot:4668963-Alexandrium_andersonii.AAC.1
MCRRAIAAAWPTLSQALVVGEESSLYHWASCGKNALQLDLRRTIICSGANLGQTPAGAYSGGRSLA